MVFKRNTPGKWLRSSRQFSSGEPGPESGFQEHAKLLVGSVYAGVTFAVCELIGIAIIG